MARRSARLKKRSPTPSEGSSRDSWSTAQSAPSPAPERLSSVVEDSAPPAAMNTPKAPKAAAAKKAAGGEKPESQIPQPSTAATPLKTKSSKSLMSAFSRTPKNRTPIKPTGEEMHPALHHASTAKPLDEARWLGFQALSSHTVLPKATDGLGLGQAATPSKTPMSTHKMPNLPPSSPDFKFSFKSPVAGLSPKASKILTESHKKAAAAGRALFGTDEFSAPTDVTADGTPRKIAVPKGKAPRFSDMHMAEFKKMDSIANHASAFRADPSRFKPVDKSLKRSPSKADLDKQEPAARVPNKLKRTQSKIDIADNKMKPPVSKLVATPLKRTQSKIGGTPSTSNLPRAQSTVRLVPPTRDGRPPTQSGDSPAKRFKRTEADDAASTRPASKDGSAIAGQPRATDRPIHPKMAPRGLAARLMTPTKSSLMRSQSVKAVKSTSMIQSPTKSPSAKSILSPSEMGTMMKEGIREGIRKTSDSLHKVRSILRTPNRKYSDDPEKVAAGTHMSPPLVSNFASATTKIPATAPIKKHVNFSSSTLQRAELNELGKSPSPMKLRAGSEVPAGAVLYPKLHGLDNPVDGEEFKVGSPSRRLTFGGDVPNHPTDFSFESDKAINFGPATAGTIRMVRKSDASSLVEGKKRKLDTEEVSDKENNEPVEEEMRSPKKARMASVEPPQTPSSVSKLPRRTPKKHGGTSISKSRLAFLSTPKRPKA